MEFQFYDGTVYEVSDQSTKSDIILVRDSFEEADDIEYHFTEKNMKFAMFNHEMLTKTIPLGVTASRESGEKCVTIHVHCREKTEIELLTEKVNDTENALMELAEIVVGGEEE